MMCKKAEEFVGGNSETVKPLTIEKGIELQNVHFRYNLKQENYALQNINLYFPVNQMTAVVGRSGAGKSTLIDLLMGLNKPEKGQMMN